MQANTAKFLLHVSLILILIQTALSLKCYSCDTETCKPDQTVDCNLSEAETKAETEAKCLKVGRYTADDKKTINYSRNCHKITKEKKQKPCNETLEGPLANVAICELCTQDLCNSAYGLKATVSVAFVIFSYIFKRVVLDF